MAQIKIISNPYEQKIEFFTLNHSTNFWEEIQYKNPNSKLREDQSGKSFLPFKIKEIIDTIIEEYDDGVEKIKIFFEGTKEEYDEVKKICAAEEIQAKIELAKIDRILDNAKVIIKDTKKVFESVKHVIENIVKDDECVLRDLNKVADALDDIIPICVFGNVSAGKSTFINSLIGHEILPSGGDPLTAKIFKVSISEQPDQAWICFKHCEETVELLFEGESYRVYKGNQEDTMLVELKEILEGNQSSTMYSMINKTLQFINGYEKKDAEVKEISDVVEVKVPFSKEGVLGTSRNNFVIFDTPGSNSNSNIDHSKVLAEALQGFSNGIPVWVSPYEAIDSNDNAKLCDDVLNIKALDKRFTMIVINKAEGSDLPENGFSEKQIKNILEYNSVEKMYASGIYFVSSIMGLGAKNNGKLTDKHYRMMYRSQKDRFTDEDDVDYATLYIYNIMPEQIKEEVIGYSKACANTTEDLVYANSGLYCIEQEIEDFASKYSAYNKCQMVFSFLDNVVSKANERIDVRTKGLAESREHRKKELEAEKAQLLETLATTSEDNVNTYYKESVSYIKTYVANSLDYSYKSEDLAELDSKIAEKNEMENDYSTQEEEYEKSKSSMWSNFKANSQGLLKRNFIESIRAMKDDLVKDYKELQESKSERDYSRSEIDKATSDEIMEIVVNKYKESILDAKEKTMVVFKEHWSGNAESLKNVLIGVIAGSEALSIKQREDISELIVNYQGFEIDDEANTVFIKAKFLKGQIFGLRLGDSERLNTNRLAKKYNDMVEKNVHAMAVDLNLSCYETFKSWKNKLCSVIEENITELNPKLSTMALMIKEETEKINELEENRQLISNSLESIKALMEWKEL